MAPQLARSRAGWPDLHNRLGPADPCHLHHSFTVDSRLATAEETLGSRTGGHACVGEPLVAACAHHASHPCGKRRVGRGDSQIASSAEWDQLVSTSSIKCRASTMAGPYQKRDRPETSRTGMPPKASGPLLAENG